MEVWNAIDVFGPQADIDRLKDLLLVPLPDDERFEPGFDLDFTKVVPDAASRVWGQPWNLRTSSRFGWGEYWLGFDTEGQFPEPLLERLAAMFPSLHFDCDCIAEGDEFCGYGWYNVPKFGEPFAYHDVPEGYWDTRVHKRGAAEQALHEAVIATIKSRLLRLRQIKA